MRAALVVIAVLLVVPAASAKQRATVVIDPGHDLRANSATEPIGPGSATRKIKDGGGTHGVVSGLREADLNLRVALRLRALLERAGVRVVMTRTATAGHEHRQHRAGADRQSRRARRSFCGSMRTARRIPARAGRTRSIPLCGRGGPTTSTRRAGAPRSSSSASCDAALGFPDRGLQERSDFTGFNWADVPVILVEMGFMTNRTEDRLLATPAYQRRAAVGLCRGALRFLGRSTAPCG